LPVIELMSKKTRGARHARIVSQSRWSVAMNSRVMVSIMASFSTRYRRVSSMIPDDIPVMGWRQRLPSPGIG
jgi:hypothetical protein